MNVSDAIRTKRAVREFSDSQLSEKLIYVPYWKQAGVHSLPRTLNPGNSSPSRIKTYFKDYLSWELGQDTSQRQHWE
jgi:hypothetical protein